MLLTILLLSTDELLDGDEVEESPLKEFGLEEQAITRDKTDKRKAFLFTFISYCYFNNKSLTSWSLARSLPAPLARSGLPPPEPPNNMAASLTSLPAK